MGKWAEQLPLARAWRFSHFTFRRRSSCRLEVTCQDWYSETECSSHKKTFWTLSYQGHRYRSENEARAVCIKALTRKDHNNLLCRYQVGKLCAQADLLIANRSNTWTYQQVLYALQDLPASQQFLDAIRSREFVNQPETVRAHFAGTQLWGLERAWQFDTT